jgi:hypothetical protein
MTPKTYICPHCNRTMDLRGAYFHRQRCTARPGVRDLVRRLMQSDDPARAVPKTVYGDRADAYNAALGPDDLSAPSWRALEEQHGGWAGACKWAGYERSRKVGGVTSGMDFDDIAEGVEMEKQAAAAILQDERYGARGLPVCRVRQLPDGRTAYVLR